MCRCSPEYAVDDEVDTTVDGDQKVVGLGELVVSLVQVLSTSIIIVVLENDPSVSQSVFTITVKAPTRAFSWLKAPITTAFTFKNLLRHYAKRALTPRKVDLHLICASWCPPPVC